MNKTPANLININTLIYEKIAHIEIHKVIAH